MRKIGGTIFALSLVVAAAAVSPAQSENEARFDAVASRVVAAMNAQDAEALSRDFDAAMRKAVPPEQVRALMESVSSQFGKIVAHEKQSWENPTTAIYRLTADRGQLELVLTLDSENKIAGLLVRPTSAPATRNSVALQLPFRGRWLVSWGGPTAAQNAHHDVPNQRFALDLVAVGPTGEDSHGDKTRNEDYFAYGQEVLAPAQAEVTDVIDGVRDNRPGSMNPFAAVGNAVILRVAEREYAVLAHLKPGSIRVRPGDHVSAGQLLAQCGNSGNSSQPHLHFHLQQTPVLQDGIGIECFFESVDRERDGERERLRDYSPVKGDIVSSGSTPPI